MMARTGSSKPDGPDASESSFKRASVRSAADALYAVKPMVRAKLQPTLDHSVFDVLMASP
jgi:hypothetical protein